MKMLWLQLGTNIGHCPPSTREGGNPMDIQYSIALVTVGSNTSSYTIYIHGIVHLLKSSSRRLTNYTDLIRRRHNRM